MGTNYYWRLRNQPETPKSEPCPHCGHTPKPEPEPEVERDEGIHIGKSSNGWCFALRVYPRELVCGWKIHTLSDWLHAIRSDDSREVVNEYGDVVDYETLGNIILKRSWQRPDTGFDYERNHAVPGPDGLARHKLGGFCIQHGEGTYDLVVGDFS